MLQRVTKIGLGALAGLLGLLAAAWLFFGHDERNKPEPDEIRHLGVDAGSTDSAADPEVVEVGGTTESTGHRLEVRGGAGGPVHVKVSGPVLYPAFEGSAAPGLEIVVPSVYEAHPVEDVEVMAFDETSGFWGNLTLPGGIDLEPLEVRRVCATRDGQPANGARVRLSLAQIGFLSMEADVADGCAVFRLPAGVYSASVKDAGRLTVTAWLTETQLDIDLVPASMVRGLVVDAQGNPLPDVLVSLAQNGVTRAVTQTDAMGAYAIDGVPAARSVLWAQAPGFVPATSPTLALARLDRHNFVLERGRTVEVVVKTSGGDLVEGAAVQWQKGAEQGVVATSAQGVALLSGVPNGASLVAVKGRFSSAPVAATDRVTLVIDGDLPGKMLLRIDGVEPLDVRVSSGVSGSCFVSGGGRDWVVESCQPGSGQIEVETDSGTFRWTGALHDALSIDVPPPTRTEIEFQGSWPWQSSRLFVVSGAQRLPLQIQRNRVTIVSRESPLRVIAQAGEERIFDVVPGGQKTIEADAPTYVEFRVVDDRNAPVTGAWVAVVREGRVVETATSAGGLPLRLKLTTADQVVAVDPRRGQGRLEPGADLLALDQPVDPGNLGLWPIQTDAAELGFELVRDGKGWMIDVQPGKRAAELGILRGSWLVAAQSAAGRRTLWVHQNGKVQMFTWKE